MSLTPLVTLAAEASGAAPVNPYVVGISIFVVLLVLMGGLLAFGGGRDHS